MNRIRISNQCLDKLIQKKAPGWRRWAELKPLLLDLQGWKCGFCQGEIGGRKDSQEHRDLYEQDVEHYRPKREVTPRDFPEAAAAGFATRHGPETGYPGLEMNPRNYLASCKTCNSSYKRNFFPIRCPLADYSDTTDLGALAAEQPFLLMPFGEHEPRVVEELITFLGATCVPHPLLDRAEFDYWRAKVTIELLGLNRYDLLRRRSEAVLKVSWLWCLCQAEPPGLTENEEFLGCKRAFLDLCQRDPGTARRLALAIARELGQPPVNIRALEAAWPSVSD